MGDRALLLGRGVAAAAFALLLAAAFPFRAGDLRFDLGAVAGWFVLAPLVWLVRDLGPKGAFLWTTAAATAGYSLVLFWLFVVVHEHGGMAPPLAALAVVFVSFAVAAHTGLAAALAAWLEPAAGRLSAGVLPAAWVVTEHLRSFDLFGGFPWAYLGYAVHRSGPLLELASLGGVWALSFVLALFGVLVGRGRWRAASLLLAAVVVSSLGLRALRPEEPVFGRPLRAGIVQANIPQSVKWDPDRAREHFESHLELSRMVAATGVDLLVWPEASVPFLVERDRAVQDALLDVARAAQAPLVVGGLGLDLGPEGEPWFHNSAFALTPAAGIVDRYDKTHLVPFGEYVPLQDLFRLFRGLAAGMVEGAFVPGERPRVLEGLGSLAAGHAPTVLICYEVIYPSLVRRAVLDGARLLINVTNDAWYGRTSAPHQFLAVAAMRSAEHGIPMIRAANTGVSGVVDSYGTVLRETPIFESWALPVEVPAQRRGRTLYTWAGDWVVWACWIGLIASGGRRLVRRDER